MTGDRFDFNDRLRCLLLLAAWLSYASLSVVLIIALLTDWPEFLHGDGVRLGPW